MFIALQPDGSRIRLESWVVQMWNHGVLRDPLLLGVLMSAVRVYSDWGPF